MDRTNECESDQQQWKQTRFKICGGLKSTTVAQQTEERTDGGNVTSARTIHLQSSNDKKLPFEGLDSSFIVTGAVQFMLHLYSLKQVGRSQ